MDDIRSLGELYLSREGGQSRLELVVPQGTTLESLTPIIGHISENVTPKLSRTGCAPCLSGVPVYIHERFDHVARVDLDAAVLLDKLPLDPIPI